MHSGLHFVVGERSAFTGTMNDQEDLPSLKQADKESLLAIADQLGRSSCVVTEIDDITTTLVCDGNVVAMFHRSV